VIMLSMTSQKKLLRTVLTFSVSLILSTTSVCYPFAHLIIWVNALVPENVSVEW